MTYDKDVTKDPEIQPEGRLRARADQNVGARLGVRSAPHPEVRDNSDKATTDGRQLGDDK